MADFSRKPGIGMTDAPNFKNNLVFLDQNIDQTTYITFLETAENNRRMWAFYARERMHCRLWKKVRIFVPLSARYCLAHYDALLLEAIAKGRLQHVFVDENKWNWVLVYEAVAYVMDEIEKKRNSFVREKNFLEYEKYLEVLYELCASQYARIPYVMPLKSKRVMVFRSERGKPANMGVVAEDIEDVGGEGTETPDSLATVAETAEAAEVANIAEAVGAADTAKTPPEDGQK